MTRTPIEFHLAHLPAPTRARILADRDRLEPGAAAVMARFWTFLQERREPADAPSAAVFTAAAASESTLATLLRALARYAPEIGTAAARDLRRAYYCKRPSKTIPLTDSDSSSRPGIQRPVQSAVAGRNWPLQWRAHLPALLAAPIRETSRRRYLASINRCAKLVQSSDYGAGLDLYMAACLAEDIEAGGVRPITIAGYLDALIALARAGSAPQDDIDGMRLIRTRLAERAAMGTKRKVARLVALDEAGGHDAIGERLTALQAEASVLPHHSARKQALRQQIALCLIHLQKPARTGDVSRWRLGRDLVRSTDGRWNLQWRQQKTGHDTEAGPLWDEVCEALDELALGGRPARFIHLRYQDLLGRNWLTLTDTDPPAKWPSAMIRDAIGLPSHDLRTLAADLLRRHDPATAGNLISALLGHRSTKAAADYRAMAEAETATRDWQDMRAKIAVGTGVTLPASKPSRTENAPRDAPP